MFYNLQLGIDDVNRIGLALGKFPHDDVRALLDNLQAQVNQQNAANIAKEKQAIIDEYLAACGDDVAGAEVKAPATPDNVLSPGDAAHVEKIRASMEGQS